MSSGKSLCSGCRLPNAAGCPEVAGAERCGAGPVSGGRCRVARGVLCVRSSREEGWDEDPGACSNLKLGRRTEPRWCYILSKSGAPWPCG
jgi:hypothetical protein